ncbi:MAG: 50S ribosomal protein L11 methyltransferase [Chitinophagaceae bacterium]
MPNYIELKITVTETAQKEILIARLADAGATGFEEEKGLLKAYMEETVYNENKFNEIIEQNGVTYSKSVIEERNWNAEWESDFQSVEVDDFCSIRAAFHPPNTVTRHDIIITPKMSFGTGHHATTHMMVKAMAGLDIESKTVFDFGTGTGVLAILAEKCGAASVVAIDNDAWSIANSIENFNANTCCKVLISKSEDFEENVCYDIILANINRNIILKRMGDMKQHLAVNGVVLLSGLLTGDEPLVVEEAWKQQLVLQHRLEMNGWICLQMVSSR